MRIRILLYIILCSNLLFAQSSKFANTTFFWVSEDSSHFAKIKFENNSRFQLIEDNNFDCTPDFVKYGHGRYKIIQDSIQLLFDTISTVKSVLQIDTVYSDNKFSNVSISVYDKNGIKLNNVELHWGKPIKRGKWTTAQFFKEEFNAFTNLKLKSQEKINFMRVEKKGYYPSEINMPSLKQKDLNIKIILTRQPKINSKFYFSGTTINLGLLSSSEIQYIDGRVLKKVLMSD